jgi:hypothetical protein
MKKTTNKDKVAMKMGKLNGVVSAQDNKAKKLAKMNGTTGDNDKVAKRTSPLANR